MAFKSKGVPADAGVDRGLAPAAGPGGLPAWRDALGIWIKQVRTSRTQTEEAIGALTGRFAGIVGKLEAAVAASEQTAGEMVGHGGDGVGAALGRSRDELASVIDALNAIQRSREELAAEMRTLESYTEGLSKMAAAVEKLAAKTHMLSLNASIEAAHAGEAGRGFAALAQEVRELSKSSRDTGKRIGDTIATINQGLSETSRRNAQAATRDTQAAARCELLIQGVLERFAATTDRLAGSAEDLRRESTGIKDEIAQSLVQLQFQDRVSQVLSHVENSMTNVADVGDTGAVTNGAQAVLDDMMRTYTTDEQRRNHAGLAVESVAPQEPTFF